MKKNLNVYVDKIIARYSGNKQGAIKKVEEFLEIVKEVGDLRNNELQFIKYLQENNNLNHMIENNVSCQTMFNMFLNDKKGTSGKPTIADDSANTSNRCGGGCSRGC